ncbi:putative short chain dehydrogenase/ reductase [Colletotrichum somersetense]|nr:putative short chain dehydrogenase/ reductase [Colletotrichum somersetense]
MSLAGKVFAITGAASGIGRATAALLCRRGALLSLADINTMSLAAVKDELEQHLDETAHRQPHDTDRDDLETRPSRILTTVLDVRSSEGCKSWMEATAAHFKRPLSGAANLAGVFGPSIGREVGAVRHITDAEFDRVMDVNVKGTLNCLRAQLPYMAPGGAAVVNAASIAGISGVLYNVPYVASKHAIVGITRTLAKEEGPRGIRANAVAPGIIDTPMVAQIYEAMGPGDFPGFGEGDPGALGRKGSAQEVAEVVIFLLGPESGFVNGVVVPVDGGWIC